MARTQFEWDPAKDAENRRKHRVAFVEAQYAFADPLLRVWVRLNSRCAAAGADRTLDEVQRYAVARLSAGPVTPR